MTKLTPEQIRDISEAVYRIRLGEDDTARMIEKRGEAYLRGRAAGYDVLTRAYLRVLQERPPTKP